MAACFTPAESIAAEGRDDFLRELSPEKFGPPRCFRDYRNADLAMVSIGGKGDCRSCPKRQDCLSTAPADCIDAEGKPPCFGSGPHSVAPDRTCAHDRCGVGEQCRAAHDRLFARRHTDYISKVRRAALPFATGETLPSPPRPPAGEAIEIAAPGMAVPIAEATPRVVSAPAVRDEAVAAASSMPLDAVTFDRAKADLEPWTDGALHRLVCDLSHGRTGDRDEGAVDYDSVRERFLAGSFLLNERAGVAPRFRELNPLSKSSRDPTYLRDLQLVDLHWLSIWGTPSPVDHWTDLFSEGRLNMAQAWKFACDEVTPEAKVMRLGLGGIEEHCLTALRRRDVSQVWKRSRESRDAVLRKIKRALEAPGGRLKIEPTVMFDVYRAYRAAEGCPHATSRLMQHMGHSGMTPQVIRRRVEWLGKAGVGIDVPETS